MPFPNPSHVTVTVETAALTAIVTFVLGFFSNLLAMRKMFVTRSKFDDHVAHNRETHSEIQQTMVDMEVQFEQASEKLEARVITHCDSQRRICEPLGKSIENIWNKIDEIGDLLRDMHGTQQYIQGILKNNLDVPKGDTKWGKS